jgi:putative transposase
MYRWRKLTPQQRVDLLDDRKQHKRPWHSPPHYESDAAIYLITAACYEHKPLIGMNSKRIAAFEADLLQTVDQHGEEIFAWVILPNHYHVLLRTQQLKMLLKSIGQLHGRTSFLWNGEDQWRGRQVWCGAAETAMKSERHFWATLN